MNYKSVLILAVLALLPAAAFAQNIQTISFVPVKTGVYDNLVVRSHARLAQNSGNVTANSLVTYTLNNDPTLNNSNSTNLRLNIAGGFSIAKPSLLIRNNVFTSALNVTAGTIRIYEDAAVSVAGHSVATNTYVNNILGKSVNWRFKLPYIAPSGVVYIGPVKIYAPPASKANAGFFEESVYLVGGTTTVKRYIMKAY